MTKMVQWLPATALAVGLILGSAASGLTQAQTAPPKRDPERHPHIRAAMRDLRQAGNLLQHAAHDYDGHRVKALEHVKQAEGELQAALEWAKAHPDAPTAKR